MQLYNLNSADRMSVVTLPLMIVHSSVALCGQNSMLLKKEIKFSWLTARTGGYQEKRKKKVSFSCVTKATNDTVYILKISVVSPAVGNKTIFIPASPDQHRVEQFGSMMEKC